MKHISTLVAFLLLFAYGGLGQTTTLTGIVLDSASRQPMPYVLLEVSDTANASVGGGITDSLGRYSLDQIPRQPIILRASTTGYRTKSTPVTPTGKRTELAPILLSLDTIAIADVRVLGKAPELTLRPNRQEIRLQQADVQAGIPLSEMLARLPDFRVTPQGGLLLRDNSFTLLINGRPSHISVAEINTIDPATIERIEVITNPSASQRASMRGGIVNIIVRKPKLGFNAVLQALGGLDNYYDGNFSANVVIPKFSFFTSIYANYNGVLVDLKNSTKDNGSLVHRINAKARSNDWTVPPKIGMEYMPNDKRIYSIFYSAYYVNKHPNSISKELEKGRTPEETQAEQSYQIKGLSHSVNAGFSQGFSNKSSITSNLVLSLTSYGSYAQLDGDMLPHGEAQRIIQPNQKEYSAQLNVDYTLPLSEKGQVKVGIAGDYNLASSSAEYFTSPLRANTWTSKALFPTAQVQRQTYGAFTELEYQILEPLSLSAGIRYEFNHLKISNEAPFSRLSNLPFGSFGLSYSPLNWLQTSLSYSGRIFRPNMDSYVNMPIISDFVNERYQPNPNLKDVYTHSVEFSAQQSFEHISLWENVGYSYDSNPFYLATLPDPAGGKIWIRTTANMKWAQSIEGTLSISSRPIEQLSLRLNGTILNNRIYNFDGKEVTGNKVAGYSSFSATGYLPKGFTITARFQWIAPRPGAFRNELAHYYLSAAIYYRPIQNLSIAISGDNLINQPWQKYTTRDAAGRETLWTFNWRPRSFYLSIFWRIGKNFRARFGEWLRTEQQVQRSN